MKLKKFKYLINRSCTVLDGEVVSNNFQALMKQIHRKASYKIKMQNYSYLIFTS